MDAGCQPSGPAWLSACLRQHDPHGANLPPVAFRPTGTMEALFVEGGALSPLTTAAFAEPASRHGTRGVGPPLA